MYYELGKGPMTIYHHHLTLYKGYGSTLMSEVPEGYLPTSAETVEYLSTNTWRSGSQDVMMLTSRTLATMETATLPLSTPPPTLQTTVANSIPTDSVLPTLGLQDNLGGKCMHVSQPSKETYILCVCQSNKEAYRCLNQMHAEGILCYKVVNTDPCIVSVYISRTE